MNSSAGTTARRLAAVAMALATLAGQPAADAATIAVHSERHGDAIHIRASVVLNADAVTAWHVLTDYGRYTEFIPDLRRSHVAARRGSTVTVEQSGDATLWMFKWPLNVTFEITETPPSTLQSRAVAGSLRTLVSSYALTPVTPGIRLDYVGRVETDFALLGHIERTAVERNVARQFQALADEIERQAAIAR